MRNFIKNTSLSNVEICTRSLFDFPPWKKNFISYLNPFHNFQKSSTTALIFNQFFQAHRDEYSKYIDIYTDGSKMRDHVGCSFVTTSITQGFKLHPSSSIFTAEILATIKALDFISSHHKRHFIIYTASLSVLESLQSGNPTHSLISVVLKQYASAIHNGYHIKFCWTPFHVGIPGNEAADICAKNAIQILNDLLPLEDFKRVTKCIMLEEWQLEWNEQVGNKLYSIKSTVSLWPSLSVRKLDVLLTRLRIGHTRVTHKHLLLNESPPICFHCNCHLTIKHILTECTGLTRLYNKFFHTCTPSLQALIGEHHHNSIFSFLKSTGFYPLM